MSQRWSHRSGRAGPSSSADGRQSYDDQALAARLWQVARHSAHPSHAQWIAAQLVAEAGALAHRAGRIALADALDTLWRDGWQPVDVWQTMRRRCTGEAAGLVAAAITEQSRRHATGALHPRWRRQLAQLAQLGAEPSGQDPVAALTLVLRTLGEMSLLPRLPKLVAPPGEYRVTPGGAAQAEPGTAQPGAGEPGAGAGEPGAGEVDPKMLTRVRALLAKAESTDYPEEADAFFAKAQELMSRYSLERAVSDRRDRGDAAYPHTGGRRIWLDNPYLSPKSMVVNAVATANRCQCVFHRALGFVTVVGVDTDTEIVELLATSLLVQASRAMVYEGGHASWNGVSRTRSFRHSFLLAYAQRIGERLGAAASQAEAEARCVLGEARLLPALAVRQEAVQRQVAEYFPQVSRHRVSASDPRGWAAGRAAADQANLDIHPSLPGESTFSAH